MKTFILTSVLVPSLANAAVKSVSTGISTSTVLASCTTLLGSKSLATIPTKFASRTLHSTAHVTSTITPSTTVWPSTEATSTSIVNSMITVTISEAPLTDYTTSFSTLYQTTTFTESDSTTITKNIPSTIYTTSTNTVATSQGFIPAASGQGYPGAKKRAADNRFDLDARAKASSSSSSSQSFSTSPARLVVQAGKLVASPAQYPTSVQCATTIEAISTIYTFSTALSTSTITAPPFTTTVYTTNFMTTTSTFIPADVQVTTIFVDEIAISTTTTMTSTSTSSVTNIVTVAAPDATYYAACSPANLVSSASGASFGALQVSGTVQPAFWYTNIATAYDCCALCMQTNSCSGASFVDHTCSVYPVGGTDGSGSNYGAPVCSQGYFFGSYFPWSGGDSQTVINGVCGQWSFGQGSSYRLNGGHW